MHHACRYIAGSALHVPSNFLPKQRSNPFFVCQFYHPGGVKSEKWTNSEARKPFTETPLSRYKGDANEVERVWVMTT